MIQRLFKERQHIEDLNPNESQSDCGATTAAENDVMEPDTSAALTVTHAFIFTRTTQRGDLGFCQHG